MNRIDDFWSAVHEQVAALPLDTVEQDCPVFQDHEVEVRAVAFRSLGGVDIHCWIAAPRASARGALVQFPAYATVLFPPVGYARQGFWSIAVSVRGHHLSEMEGVGFPGLIVHGLPGPDTYAYRGLYADALAAVRLVSERLVPQLPLLLMGQSQGAALSVFAAAMSRKPVAIAADVPFLCDIRGALELTDAFPYRELAGYLRDNPAVAAEALATIDLIDVLNFAPRVTVPVLLSLGTLDPVTPLACTRALAAALPNVIVHEYEGAGHEGGGMRHRRLQSDWLLQQVATTAQIG